MRAALLALSLLGLTLAYNGLPHRGPDLKASRYQTLLKVDPPKVKWIPREGKPDEYLIVNVHSPMEYLNTSYEDPGLYWLMDITNASYSAVELGLFAVALGLLCCRQTPLSVAIPAVAAFMLAFPLGIFYWSWDVYWAPALSVLVTMAFLLTVTRK